MDKSPDAFRTIREVAEWLETPAHVLRFWESKFSQVKPVKRAGGRRYYRPTDMKLLGGIKRLLHEDGMTIKGVQKMLQSDGVKSVAALSQPLGLNEDGIGEVIDMVAEAPAAKMPADPGPAPIPEPPKVATPQPEPEPERPTPATAPPEAAPEPETAPDPEPVASTKPDTPTPLRPATPVPDDPTDDADITVPPSVAALLLAADPDRLRRHADQLAPLYSRLKALKDRPSGAKPG